MKSLAAKSPKKIEKSPVKIVELSFDEREF